ncbi:hypothetical protein NQ314_005624 [Rhamnusium bicolor]|uniref:FGFR1 oncogene partner (FOP) N-terminal dimerisation domain-containing protein n=1 Tax=Rhamnusium bicolor TaxID=1586634 RepID=A0AAV8ZGB3_9CUCU|nr:hypothetical protein NQ314_005624 [Rhamnusium bicolor]
MDVLPKLGLSYVPVFFLALDEDVKISKQQPLLNTKIKTHLETEEGKAMFCIVREFLEFFNLYFTLSVFEPESYMGNGYQYEDRQKVAKDLGLDIIEDTTVPLLLQLIKIAQVKTKSIEINLNMKSNGIEDNKSLSQDIDSTSDLKKTDSANLTSKLPNSLISYNEKHSEADKKSVENNSVRPTNLNATFDLSSPTMSLNITKKTENDTKKRLAEAQNDLLKEQILDSTYSKREGKDDDTYEDTSSIAEDSVALINFDNTIKASEVLQPVLKEGKTIDKLKFPSQKSEKLKSKSTLSSLSDLPPLQMNKSRVNDILPSLYSKEFKDKSNLRELDKLFDMDAEYEEDFICSGDDLSLKSDYLKSDHSKINLLEDIPFTNKTPSSDKSNILNKRELKQNKSPNKIISDCNKPLYKSLVNSQKGNDVINSDSLKKNESASNSSVSENLEISNSD